MGRALAVALALALLAGAGLLVARTRGERAAGAPASAELEALRAALAEEQAALAALAEEVARHERALAALRGAAPHGADGAARAPQPERTGSPPGAAPDEAAAAGGSPAGASPAAAVGEAPQARRALDDARLAGAGLPPREAEELRRLFDDTELERLYLQDQAHREGWPAERLEGALAAVDARFEALRGERGEATYDWFLYASGRPNRVVVDGVLGGSAAAAAGLRPGDVLYAYAGGRLFEPLELVEATHQGRLHESVEIEVERDGARTRVSVPRGPLGVRVAGRTVRPDAPAR